MQGRGRPWAQIGCGQGVPEDLVHRCLADGRLKRVLEDWCQPHSGYHLYRQSRRQSSPAFALLVDGLRYRNYSSSGITPPMTMSRERMLSLKTRTPKSILICTIASRDLFVNFLGLSRRFSSTRRRPRLGATSASQKWTETEVKKHLKRRRIDSERRTA